MENNDIVDEIAECLSLVDENIDVLSDIVNDIEVYDEDDDLEPNLELCELFDMVEDAADSSRIKKAEDRLMERQLF